MNIKHKIAFLIPWFGPFPKWMQAYLTSCRYNENIDFYIFTDSPIPKYQPKNVTFTQISFKNYCEKVSNQLGINFKPENAYKLCDLKPAYGKVHKDILNDYGFWGFGDIDVILGDIRSFLTDELLDKYEFFSTHESRIAGHFTVMKNNDKWRNMFMRRSDWKESFESQKHVAFDEKSFSKLFIRFKNLPLLFRNIMCKVFLSSARKAYIKEMYSTPGLRYNWIDGSRNFPTEWYWKNGKLTNNVCDREFLYFHFLEWKKYWATSNEISYIDDIKHDDQLIISQNGFTSQNS